MKPKKSNKLGWIAIAIVALLFLMQSACVRAEWAKHRIRRGMRLGEVLQVTAGWDFGSSFSSYPAPNGRGSILFHSSGSYRLHVRGEGEEQQLASPEELARFLDRQMNDGHPWSLSLTYFGAIRATFNVFFDGQGRVQSISDLGGPP